MGSEVPSWRSPGHLVASPGEVSSHSKLFHFYKSFTCFLSSFHPRGENVLVGQCLGIQTPQTQEFTGLRLCLLEREDFSLVGLANGAKLLPPCLLLFLK